MFVSVDSSMFSRPCVYCVPLVALYTRMLNRFPFSERSPPGDAEITIGIITTTDDIIGDVIMFSFHEVQFQSQTQMQTQRHISSASIVNVFVNFI